MQSYPAEHDYEVDGIGHSVRPEDLIYHEVIVLVKILRVLREVAELHDKVWKSSPSFVRATVGDLAAESAERVRAIMGKANILPHMST